MNGESALLRAVRDKIRAHTSFTDRQVDIEFDEMAPATAGDVYVMVLFGGVDETPINRSSGTVKDYEYGVDVAIAIRSPRKPRDRQRELWVDTAASFEVYENAIRDQVDFSYSVLDDANTLMIAETEATGKCDEFIIPLRLTGVGPIRRAPAEVFAGVPGSGYAALIRTMRFRGARRPTTRS